MKKLILYILISFLTNINVYSQIIDVTQIELNFTGDSNPKNITKGISKIYFLADDGIHGDELWVYDGLTNNTFLVKDVIPGSNGIDSSYFLVSDDILYFTANNGTQLWRSDGTEIGTYLIKQVNNNNWSANIGQLIKFNNQIFFGANDGVNGLELWTSDGTPSGTNQLKDINIGSNSSSPRDFFIFNEYLYFTADDGLNGREIWKSDGTPSGTSLLKNINPTGNGLVDTKFIFLNNYFYFYAYTSLNGFELWRSDGTENNTFLFKDINPGSGNSNTKLIGESSNDYFIFQVNNSIEGTEFWKCDGTVVGTTLLKDIYTGSGSSVNIFTQLASINNKIYFNATTNSNGNELWVTDGTNAGTTLVKDIYLGTLNSNIEKLTSINDYLLFSANDGNRLYNTLWKSDGTPNGTFELKDTNLTQNSDMDLRFVEFNGEVFFPSGYNSSNGVELWKTDGTSTNTNLFEDIFHRYSGVYDFFDSAEINGKLIISGNNGNGKEPFVTDGTVNGTFIIKDINPGSSASIFSSSDFRPASYTKAGNYVFFRAASSNIGFELWKTDGTQTNTSLVKDIKSGSGSSLSEFTFFAELNGILYFKADDGIHGEELWRSDGTNEGTYLVKDINPGSAPSLNGISNVYYNEPNILNEKCFAILNGFLYFTAKDGIDNSIWKTDGTESGTIKVITIQQSGGYDNNRIILNATNNKIFFKTNTTNSSYGNNSLWSSDGTQAGTIHLYHTDITGPTQFKKNIIHDDNLYFSVYDSNGLTLIKSDGTVGGTIVIKDNLSFSPNMNIKSLISCGGNVYFSIGEQGSIDAKELWRTDGSTFGTLKLGDLTNSSSIFENFNYCNTCYQENLIFNKTSINDNKIYYVNANSTNTDSFLTPNIINSESFGETGNYGYTNFYAFNDILIFNAWKEESGTELFSSIFNITLDNNDFEISSSNNIKIYPNPAKEIINIISSKNELIERVEIYDLLGKNIFSSTINDNRLALPLLSNGIYIIKIKSSVNQYSKKLIIKN
ncbi:MAG: T9SS type A sorting domain-containing protein [Flavobacterium sp.]|nr:MAG: T9SS type A sorting domain-containing protein [Flavobacterium sp.]